jgi:hypothetical protein
MELEAVGRVTMCHLCFKIGRQVDDVYSAEWTFLGADTASDAETFRDEGNFGVRSDFNAKLASANDWARFLAFLATFLRFAL